MHTILFTGHMIDKKGREVPRFPAAKEDAAREAIKKELVLEAEKYKGELMGIAGGAAGGDILFHEICKEMHIPSEVYLALPEEDYKKASVSFAGKFWKTRFDKLIENNPVQVLTNKRNEQDNIWERTNLWMLKEALRGGGENMTLIALWDGKGGDGKGGTEHMVEIAKEKGAKTKIIDTKNL